MGKDNFSRWNKYCGLLSTYDLFRGALVYVPMGRYTITCNGVLIDSVQKVQNCIDNTAILMLPNNQRLSFTIQGVDQYKNIGGWLNFNELQNMMSQVKDVTCIAS